MVANHSVKVGGVWYRAGQEIPPEAPPRRTEPAPPGEVPREPPKEESKPDAAKAEDDPRPSKNQIKKTNVPELRAWIKRLKIAGNTAGMNGAEMRKMLMIHYKL